MAVASSMNQYCLTKVLAVCESHTTSIYSLLRLAVQHFKNELPKTIICKLVFLKEDFIEYHIQFQSMRKSKKNSCRKDLNP